MADPRVTGLRLPWWLYDIQNKQLIMSPSTVPGDISDKKSIVLAEQPIPGLDYNPVNPAGGGNRIISFTIPIINRLTYIGNVLILKQFDRLRHKAGSFIFKKTQDKFTPPPKVLYNWGTGSVPLEWYVKDIGIVNKGDGWQNEAGNPQYTNVQVTLELNQQSDLYKVEEIWREFASYAGQIQGVTNTVQSFTGSRSI